MSSNGYIKPENRPRFRAEQDAACGQKKLRDDQQYYKGEASSMGEESL